MRRAAFFISTTSEELHAVLAISSLKRPRAMLVTRGKTRSVSVFPVAQALLLRVVAKGL